MLAARQIGGADLGGRPRLVRCHSAVRRSDTGFVSAAGLILRHATSGGDLLVKVTASDRPPARDRDVVHIADERSWRFREVVKGVCRRGSGVSTCMMPKLRQP